MTLVQDQSIIDVVTIIAHRRVADHHHLHHTIEKGTKQADPTKRVNDPTDVSLIENRMNTIVYPMNVGPIQDRLDRAMNDLLMNL